MARLIVFRTVLRRVLGSAHRDDQYLRTHRVQRGELEAAEAELEPAVEAEVDPESSDAPTNGIDSNAA